MPNTNFGPDTFQLTSAKGLVIDAKYLKDFSGNYIMDANSGKPLIVPASYDLNTTSKYYLDLKNQLNNLPGEGGAAEGILLGDFIRGGKGDLQRFFDGTNHPGDFVKEFTRLYAVSSGT